MEDKYAFLPTDGLPHAEVLGGQVRSLLALLGRLFANRRVAAHASFGGAGAHFTCFAAVGILIPVGIKRQVTTALCIRTGGSKVRMLAQQALQCAVH
jgi:hypothetical protein